MFKQSRHVLFVFLSAGDEWYLCRLSVTLPGMSDLHWAMFPEPYLTTVEPGAAPGSVVYKLLVRHRDGSLDVSQYLLVDGECFYTVFTNGKQPVQSNCLLNLILAGFLRKRSDGRMSRESNGTDQGFTSDCDPETINLIKKQSEAQCCGE